MKNLNVSQSSNLQNVNEIPLDILQEINKRYSQNLTVTLENRSYIIKIKNSFTLIIEFSSIYNSMYKLTVCALNEYSPISYNFDKKEQRTNNYLKNFKVDDKSKYKLMRKLALLFDDRMHFLIRIGKMPAKLGFYLLVVNLIKL